MSGELPAIMGAVLTGGLSAAELRDAGAIAVFEAIAELRDGLDRLPVVGPGTA